ncbi:hypothetical protein GGF32_003824 [Allomyces javanicus]|nr:hypothetical protein GGF32_003824 [Allomyces javanicus]
MSFLHVIDPHKDHVMTADAIRGPSVSHTVEIEQDPPGVSFDFLANPRKVHSQASETNPSTNIDVQIREPTQVTEPRTEAPVLDHFTDAFSREQQSYVPGPALPEETSSSPDVRAAKSRALYTFNKLNAAHKISDRKFDMNSPLKDIENELAVVQSRVNLDKTVDWCRGGIFWLSKGLVMVNNTYDPLGQGVDMEDWGSTVHHELYSTTKYDSVLEQLAEKYSSSVSVPPEVQLVGMLALSFTASLASKKREAAMLAKLREEKVSVQNEVQRQLQEQLAQMGFSTPAHTTPQRPNTPPASPEPDLDALVGPSSSSEELRRLLLSTALDDQTSVVEQPTEIPLPPSPKLNPESIFEDDATSQSTSEVAAPKRKRGRPPKVPKLDSKVVTIS